ncbi:MAG TPA: energy transducer TonB [Chroococcidiopsis sp.]
MSHRKLIRSFITTVRQNWRQPSWIAVFVSVGIHAVLGIVLPILPSSSKELEEPEIPKSVGLLELSPQEQSRLPDFSVPTVSPPPLSSSNDSDLYSLSPLPNRSDPVPNSPYTYPFQDLTRIYPSPYGGATRRQSRTGNQGRNQGRNQPPPPPPTPTPTPTATPTPTPTPTSTPTPTPTPTPTVTPSVTGTTRSDALDGLQGTRSPGSSSPVPSSTPSSAPPATNPPAGSPSPSPGSNPPDADSQRELYAYNEAGTGELEAGNRATGWFAEQRGRTWDGQNRPPGAEIVVNIPPEACAETIENLDQRIAWFGAVVDADGKLKGDPQLLRSSGYAGLNQKAQEAIASYEFENPTGGDRAYFVVVHFERDAEACAAPSADG